MPGEQPLDGRQTVSPCVCTDAAGGGPHNSKNYDETGALISVVSHLGLFSSHAMERGRICTFAHTESRELMGTVEARGS